MPHRVVIPGKVTRPPPAPGAPPRTHATATLERLLAGGVAVVAAPAGFGRRDLVAAWCERQPPGSTAWLSLDRADDPASFLRHLVAALRTRYPDIGDRALEAADQGVEAMGEWGLPSLLTEVGQHDEPLTLVLDGLHRLEDQDAQAGIRMGVRYRPDHVRLVLITRNLAPLQPWPRAEAIHTVTVGLDDLRYDADDVAHMVRVAGLTASPDAIDDLVADTNGWPAGVSLTIQESQAAGTLQRFDVATPSVDNYIHETVCRWLDDDLRHFYVDIAAAGPLDTGLCAEITGRADAGIRLRELRDRDLVDQVDGTLRVPEVVRLHVDRERSTFDPAQWSTIRTRAAQAYADRHEVTEALDVIGRDPTNPELAAIVLECHQRWSAAGHGDAVASWCERALVGGAIRPELYLVKAWAEVFSSRDPAAAATIDLLRRLPLGADDAYVRAEIEMIESSLARRAGRMQDALAHAAACAELAADAPAPPRAYAGSVDENLGVFLGSAHFYAGELEAARDVLHPIAGDPERPPIVQAATHGFLALVGWLQEDPVADIHAAVGASHVVEGTNQAELAALAAQVLVGNDVDLTEALDRLAEAERRITAPPASVFAHVARAVHAPTKEEARAELAAARDVVDRCPQPGVLTAVVGHAASLVEGVEAHDLGDPLTDGERRVLRALRGGMTERQIGEELHLSHNTVRTYRRRAYRKLGVHSRQEALEALERLESPR